MVLIFVPPIGLQNLLAPWDLSQPPPLGIPCSIQWLAGSTHLCICQAVEKTLRRKLYQALISKHLLASTIVSGFGNWIWDGSPGGAVSGWPFFFQSLLHTCFCISSHGYFVPPSKKDQSIHTLVLLLLELHVVCELYVGYSELLG
jgi:hypothetical protein